VAELVLDTSKAGQYGPLDSGADVGRNDGAVGANVRAGADGIRVGGDNGIRVGVGV